MVLMALIGGAAGSWVAYSGGNVGGADVADVLQTTVCAPYTGLLPDNAHIATLTGRSKYKGIVDGLFAWSLELRLRLRIAKLAVGLVADVV